MEGRLEGQDLTKEEEENQEGEEEEGEIGTTEGIGNCKGISLNAKSRVQ